MHMRRAPSWKGPPPPNDVAYHNVRKPLLINDWYAILTTSIMVSSKITKIVIIRCIFWAQISLKSVLGRGGSHWGSLRRSLRPISQLGGGHPSTPLGALDASHLDAMLPRGSRLVECEWPTRRLIWPYYDNPLHDLVIPTCYSVPQSSGFAIYSYPFFVCWLTCSTLSE